MKKIILLILAAVLSMNLFSCNYDPYSGSRPFDYGNAKWVCEDLNAWFIIDSSQEDYYYPEGEIEIDNVVYPFKLYFVHQTNQVFLVILKFNSGDEKNIQMGEFSGECSFSKDVLTISIDAEKDTLFDARYEKLSFIRNNLE